MANTKPKWGWHENWPDHPEVEDWEAVFACVDALNPGWTAQLKYGTTELEASIGTYFFDKFSDYPTRVEIRAAAQAINSDVNRLLTKMESADGMTRRFLHNRMLNGPGPYMWGTSSPESIEESSEDDGEIPVLEHSPDPYEILMDDLREFEAATMDIAKKAKRDRRTRSGRNSALDILIGSFAGYYEEATGHRADLKITYDKETKKYWSPFISFLSDLLDLIEKDHGYTNHAIGDAVRRYFGKRK